MIAQVLQRMNRREQILAGLVALVVFFLARIAGEAQAIHFFNADLYVGSARCAPPLPRGCTGHVAHPFRSILWRPAGFARST